MPSHSVQLEIFAATQEALPEKQLELSFWRLLCWSGLNFETIEVVYTLQIWWYIYFLVATCAVRYWILFNARSGVLGYGFTKVTLKFWDSPSVAMLTGHYWSIGITTRRLGWPRTRRVQQKSLAGRECKWVMLGELFLHFMCSCWGVECRTKLTDYRDRADPNIAQRIRWLYPLGECWDDNTQYQVWFGSQSGAIVRSTCRSIRDSW